MTDDKDKAALPAPRRLTSKPERGTVWVHRPGCTNPANAQGLPDWNCPCGPEVVQGQ